MINLKTLDDVNNYYLNRGIKPYWSIFNDKYLLKLHHIIGITRVFDKLINLFPNVELEGVGDSYTYEKYLYSIYPNKDDPFIYIPTYEKNMFGVEYSFMVGATYYGEYKVITINHSSMMVMCDNIERLVYTLTHEFAHALDETYKFYLNELFIDKYNEYINSNSDDLGDYAKKNVREFIAVAFEKSFYSEIPRAREVKELIDEQYSIK